jgi:hypothetical protein
MSVWASLQRAFAIHPLFFFRQQHATGANLVVASFVYDPHVYLHVVPVIQDSTGRDVT